MAQKIEDPASAIKWRAIIATWGIANMTDKKQRRGKQKKHQAQSGKALSMHGVDPEDALHAFMQVDPEAVKRAEKAGQDGDNDELGEE